jgi:AcrR family transcriptional regulator
VKRTERAATIVRSAAELWAVKGYHGAGIEELSQAVGLQRGALYHHIGSKEALLHEVARQAIERLLAATEDDPSRPAAERLRRFSRGLMGDIAQHQAEWTVFFREFAWLTGERQAEVFELRSRYEALWLTVLRDGAARGEFRAVDPIVVKGVLGMHNYAYLWFRPGGRLSSEEVADTFVDLLLRGFEQEETA